MIRRTRHLCLLLLLAAQGLPAASRRYIVELDRAPAIEQHRRGAEAMERQRQAVRARQGEVAVALRSAGARIRGGVETVASALFVELEEARAPQARRLAGVRRMTEVVEYRARLDRVLALSKVPEAWASIGGREKAGVGVKVAILDSGIDAGHPAFQSDTLTPPEGFPKVSGEANRAYVNNKVIVARSYEALSDGESYGEDARDGYGHGTNAAMAAAGGSFTTPAGPVSGVAPMAFLGNYKVLGNRGGGGNDLILKGIDDAFQDGMDILNLSLGSDAVRKPEEDPLVQALERVVAAGRLVMVAAGNSGPDPNSIGSPATAPNAIAVGSSSSDREFVEGVASAIDPKRISEFSSRGPNPGAGLKPDVLATGDNFLTAQSQWVDPNVNYKVTQGTSFATPTVAGAGAVLRAARPGLAEPVYRSLLVNSAMPMVAADQSVPFIRNQGAGVMNLQNAVRSTIAANPVSLKFGAGGATSSVTIPLTLTNAGATSGTFKLAVIALDERTAPRVDPAEVQLEAGASATVNVRWEGTGLSGEYQGYVRVEATNGEVKAFLPYWYAAASSTPKWISLLEPPASGKAGEDVSILARVVDASGVALQDAEVTVTPTGTVQRDSDYPGLVLITVRLAAGENGFEIRSGGVSRRHVIVGQ